MKLWKSLLTAVTFLSFVCVVLPCRPELVRGLPAKSVVPSVKEWQKPLSDLVEVSRPTRLTFCCDHWDGLIAATFKPNPCRLLLSLRSHKG
jgi:hypothetical protein